MAFRKVLLKLLGEQPRSVIVHVPLSRLYVRRATLRLQRAQPAIHEPVCLELHVNELIQLALNTGEAGVHLRLEPRVAELGVLPLFEKCCIDRVEPLVHLLEPLVHLLEPLIHLLEPLIHVVEPLIHRRR